MVGTKRKASSPVAVSSKRAHTSPALPATLSLTESELNDLSKGALIEHAIAVQKQRDDAIIQRDNYPGPKAYQPEEMDEMMHQSRQMIVDGIARLFKNWTPSCKNGQGRFSYEMQVSSPYIYRMTLSLRSGDNRKTFKMSVPDFELKVGRPEAKVGSDVIVLSGSNVNVRWDSSKNVYKISGTFKKAP